MYILWSDLLQFGLLIVGIITLCVTVYKKK